MEIPDGKVIISNINHPVPFTFLFTYAKCLGKMRSGILRGYSICP